MQDPFDSHKNSIRCLETTDLYFIETSIVKVFPLGRFRSFSKHSIQNKMNLSNSINSTSNMRNKSMVFRAISEIQKPSSISFNRNVLGPSVQAWPFRSVKASPITAAPAAKIAAKRKKRVAWSKMVRTIISRELNFVNELNL